MLSNLRANIVSQHQAITELITDLPKCRSDLLHAECDYKTCEDGKTCDDDATAALTKLFQALHAAFESEHLAIKAYFSREYFRQHAEQHGAIADALNNAIALLNKSHSCRSCIDAIQHFAELFGHHAQTLDAKMLPKIA